MFEHSQSWKDHLVESHRDADARDLGITSKVGLDLYHASRELDDAACQIRDIAERIGDDRLTKTAEKVFMEVARVLEMAKAVPPNDPLVVHYDLVEPFLNGRVVEAWTDDPNTWFVVDNDDVVACIDEDDAYALQRSMRSARGLDPITGKRAKP